MTGSRSVPRILVVLFAFAVFALSVATIPGLILHGRVQWQLGELTVFRTSHLGPSLAVAVLSLLAVTRILLRHWYDRFVGLRRRPRPCLLALLIAAAGYAALTGPNTLHGDGCEYILQTQGIVFDHTLTIHPEARQDYWNRTNPYGVRLGGTRPPAKVLSESSQSGGGFGGLYPDRFGNYRYYHFWAYSAAVAPVYIVFHLLDSSGSLEYLSFRFVNVCLLLGFFFLAYRQRPQWTTLAILGILLFSPLVPYCEWQHPEVFCLTLVFLAFHLATSRKAALLAPLLLGLAASINLPILLFFPCHLMIAFQGMDSRRAGPLAKMGMGYLAGAAVGLSSSIYYTYYFNTASVIAHVGIASLGYASLPRVAEIFFSPIIGVAFFFPLVLVALPACITRKNLATLCLILASVAAATWLATSTRNLNSGQIGTVRYAVWLIAPLWYFVFRHVPERFSFRVRGWFLIAALCISAFLILYLKTYELLGKDIRRFGGAWRAQPEVAAMIRALPFYNGDAEVVVENIMGKELALPSQFKDIYVWDLGRNDYLWILSERAIARRSPLIFRTETPHEISVEISPRQPVTISVKGNIVRVDLADHPPRMYRHPVLGNYLTLRSKGRITKVLKNQRFIIRSDFVKQVESLGEARRGERTLAH